ncbi:MAG: methionyl-tRNA formyltransferase [Proteobacteria bacterium]|nr:methionyl-tRNA formyltransferase [Pseudomonadota bacterium]
MQKLRLCFAGTPAFAAAHLAALLETRHELITAYTQPDRPSGRGRQLQSSPVKKLAEHHAIPVLQPPSLKSDEQQQLLSSLRPDVLIVVAYGLILPEFILQIPKYGCINVHASLLPRWRGAAPIERAILAGDEETGITIMQMDAGLDTGDILLMEKVSIEATDTRLDLEAKLQLAGTAALVRVVDDIEAFRLAARAQDHAKSTYANKLSKSEALIDWSGAAIAIDRQVRAGIGRSPAYSFLDRQRLRILEAQPLAGTSNTPPGTIVETQKDSFTVACTESLLQVFRIQLPGKSATAVANVLNSRPRLFAPGNVFGAEMPDSS